MRRSGAKESLFCYQKQIPTPEEKTTDTFQYALPPGCAATSLPFTRGTGTRKTYSETLAQGPASTC